MADQPPKKAGSLSRKLGPLPIWAWVLVGTLALYLGYKWYTSRTSSAAAGTTTPAASSSGGTTSTPADNSGNTGAADNSGNSELDAAIAALLGEQGANIGAITSLGQNLGDVAQTAENQLGYLASNTTAGSFSLATQAVESNSQIAQAALFANQPTTTSTTIINNPPPAPMGAPKPSSTQPPGPAPSNPGPAPYVAPSDAGAFSIGQSIAAGAADAGAFSIGSSIAAGATGGGDFTTPGATATLAASVTNPAPNPADVSNLGNPLYSSILGDAFGGNGATVSTSTDVAHPNATSGNVAGATSNAQATRRSGSLH